MDEVLDYVQQIDPLWSVALAAAALAVLLIAKLWRSFFAYVFVGLLSFAIVGAVAAAGFYGYSYLEDQRRLEERRVLEERVELLFRKTIEPDSVFACLDGSPVPAMLEACERNLFAEPQRIAAAVAIVTQRLIFLGEAIAFARERDPSYADRVAPMRNAIESDPYGFVAFVLSIEHGCTHEECARFGLMRDATRVRENMRTRRFEAYMAEHSVNWRDGAGAPTDAAAAGARSTAPLITVSGESKSAQENGPTEGKESAPAAAETATIPLPATAVETPTAALAPILTPPAGGSFAEPARESAPAAAPAAQAKGATKSSGEAAKGTAEAKSVPRPARSAAAQQKTKAKAVDPVTRRSSEPVSGLPRVVPSDYKREPEEKDAAASARSAVRPQPGAPTPIAPPAQNFTGN